MLLMQQTKSNLCSLKFFYVDKILLLDQPALAMNTAKLTCALNSSLRKNK